MATLEVRYGWGVRVFEVDADDGADLRIAERSVMTDRDAKDASTPWTNVQALFFGNKKVSDAYEPGEMAEVSEDMREWCRFLQDHEDMRSLTLNGKLLWAADGL